MTTRLVVITAGLGRPSSTRLLADRLTAATQRYVTDGNVDNAGGGGVGVGEVGGDIGGDVEVRVVELRDLASDIAQNMVTGFPGPRLRDAVDAVTSADGLIAVTPVFTGSYSGLFKSFFDVIDKDALTGIPVLIAATGGTARHSLVLEHAMRPLFSYLRAVVLPTAVYAATEDWGAAGDDALALRIDRAAAELAGQVTARSVRRPAAAEETFIPFDRQLAALTPKG
ncbi:FMN reductase [Actinacidiphila paucisporea]|uniref:FMN reductase n=1 Tax=Actinacidiphila paucisporea TaxID=310782 RepID=A0A1M7EUC3_9ACTN|nr:FMN reductase [Actinacidiphila paucisporea]SHL95233.1 FMN reductase [Actinacidiphila paucisporea]